MRKALSMLVLAACLNLAACADETNTASRQTPEVKRLPDLATNTALQGITPENLGLEVSDSEITTALMGLYFGAMNSIELRKSTGCFTVNEPSVTAVEAARAYYNNPNLLLATLAKLDYLKTPTLKFTAGIRVGDTLYRIDIDPVEGTHIVERENKLGSPYTLSKMSLPYLLQLAMTIGFETFELGGGIHLIEELTKDNAITALQNAEQFSGKPLGIDLSAGITATKDRSVRYTLFVGKDYVDLYELWFKEEQNLNTLSGPFQYEQVCGANNASLGNSFARYALSLPKGTLKVIYAMTDYGVFEHFDQNWDRLDIPPHDFAKDLFELQNAIVLSQRNIFSSFNSAGIEG
ncbi:MAG: hypothetical protein JNK26_00695 [Candidatus Doudnabacteria bacterium]|nr:hypothetical protein [Candidatus Doudnabacteria bacterium]